MSVTNSKPLGSHRPAAHVRAAVQPGSAPSPRQPAAHVQAAIQAKAVSRPAQPARHVQAAIQARAAPSHRQPAPHVQAAIQARLAPASGRGQVVLRKELPNSIPAGAARSVVQAKLGFELEIPVTLLTAERGNVPRQTTILTGKGFKIVGDTSLAAGTVPSVTGSPTIIEVVSKPFDERTAQGIERLRQCLARVEEMRDQLKELTGGFTRETTVGALADKTKLDLASPKYAKYLLNVKTKQRVKGPETASVHYTVGVALHNVEQAASWVGESSADSEQTKLMREGDAFARKAMTKLALRLGQKVVSDPTIRGFLYLSFAQVGAVELHERKGQSIAKNWISLLSRSSLASLRGNPTVAAFVAKRGEKVEEAFFEDESLASTEASALLAYALNTVEIDLEASPFGSQELPLEPVGASGVMGPPLEIRSLGQDLSYDQIRRTTDALVAASRAGFKA